MKTNDKDIEKMSRDYMMEKINHIETPSKDLADAYKAGFKACEAKMLVEASGFEDWWKGMYSELCNTTDHPDIVLANSVMEATEKAFTAGAMSQAKKDAERIKQLEDALRKIASHDTLDGEKYNSYEYGWHGVAEFAAKALQGGER
jgi:hypothetical protein